MAIRLSLRTRNVRTTRQRTSNRLKAELRRAQDKYIRRVRPLLQQRLKQALLQSPAYASVSFGILAGEFGLVGAQNKMDAIIDFIVDNSLIIRKKFSFSRNNFSAETSIDFNVNYDRLTSLSEAFQLTEKDELLPWLAWLIQSGGSVVITGYRVALRRNNRLGRSGQPYRMSRRGTYSPGDLGDANLIGTEEENFITKAILDNSRSFRRIAIRELERALGEIRAR